MVKTINIRRIIFVIVLSFIALTLSSQNALSSESHENRALQTIPAQDIKITADELQGAGNANTKAIVSDNVFTINNIENVPGPGAFLGVMLKQLSTASSESDGRIQRLIASIPQVYPELSKVLVAL
jgi:hypothetical protein